MEADTIEQAVRGFFEFHRRQYRTHPELVALYYARRGSGRIPDPRAHRAWIAELVRDHLIERKLVRADLEPLVLTVAIEMGDRIVELAHRVHPDGDPAILVEGQLAITRYLEGYPPASSTHTLQVSIH
jgi:hypothetical protein